VPLVAVEVFLFRPAADRERLGPRCKRNTRSRRASPTSRQCRTSPRRRPRSRRIPPLRRAIRNRWTSLLH